MENIPVLVVDGAVGLVADDQVEVAAGEDPAFVILGGVDAAHHGLVGGKDAAGGGVVLLLAEIGHRKIREEVHKAALGLGDQGVAVGQEEDVFHPAPAEQHITEGDNRSGLAGAGGHHQQGLAPVAPVEAVADRPHRLLLVVPPGDLRVCLRCIQTFPHPPEVHKFFQVPPGPDGGHLALRVPAVKDAALKAVGEEDHRTAAIFLFQLVGVELRLLAALGRIGAAALGLHHCQRTAILAAEEIIGVSHAAFAGHPVDGDLLQPVLPLYPAGVQQHGVDVNFPGIVLGKLQGLRDIAGLLPGPAGGELFPEGLVFRHQPLQLHLRRRGGRGFCRRLRRQQGGVKAPGGVLLAVAAGEEIKEGKEVFQADHRLVLGELFTAVGGVVAQDTHQPQPLPQVRPHHVPEVPGPHEAGQPGIHRQGQGLVHRVHPLHRSLHPPPAVEDAGGGVDREDFFGGFGDGRERG